MSIRAAEELDRKLAEGRWLESCIPTIAVKIDEQNWSWHPANGLVLGVAQNPTCIMRISSRTLLEMSATNKTPVDLVSSSQIQLGGLAQDTRGVAALFLPKEYQDTTIERLIMDPGSLSTPKKKRLAKEVIKLLTILEENRGVRLGRLRDTLDMWINHQIDRCILNQWVTISIPSLTVYPWLEPKDFFFYT